FSNFLPGISGEWGIPLWVFYVNRGQGVVSFGIQDKDHSILEFFPANKAYTFAPYLGFRTFIKINNKDFYEPFAIFSTAKNDMVIKSSSLQVQEKNPHLGLAVTVKYFTLPNTSVAALVRKVVIKNTSRSAADIELIDGLSRIIPFGSVHGFLKEISRTLEAWMHSNIEDNLATFRLIVDPRDVSHTRFIEGANFHYCFTADDQNKSRPSMIVDPAEVFGQDTSYTKPFAFIAKDFKRPNEQITLGKTPCSFAYLRQKLAAKKEITIYSIFGASFKKELIRKNIKEFSPQFIDQKEKDNELLIEDLKNHALCVSSSQEFDNYVKCTYLDNVLRGGFPYYPEYGSQKINQRVNKNAYYVFSRKHGDLERDYNYFNLLPSYFSEGQANYRDINQNRRMDIFFSPSVGLQNIIYFLNFLKIDGYNPLVLRGEKLIFEKPKAKSLLKSFSIKDQRLINLMTRGFYLGEFFKLLEEEGIKVKNGKRKSLACELLIRGKRRQQAVHQEGYWIDHWRYNLDLIESFLYFYPDKVRDLFLGNNYLFWDDEYKVKKRIDRYLLRAGKVYQGESVEVIRQKRSALKERKTFRNFLRTRSRKVYRTNLISKLLTLILNKLATLDPEGIGIEMEADKPGWCDSFNGLPALFGSSICETFELKRALLMLHSVLKVLSKRGVAQIALAKEISDFLAKMHSAISVNLRSKAKTRDYAFWNRANTIKEDFRNKVFFTISGKEEQISLKKLDKFIQEAMSKLNFGLNKAKDKKTGLYSTYFTFTVKKYQKKNSHIMPLAFTRHNLPLSMEGVTHALRVEGKQAIIGSVRRSGLYDKNIKMYKLNVSLKDESLEIGRSRAFVPGWLENESVWLHMQYKYLLEVLKNGYYKEFYQDFYNCLVCFFDPDTYGRNILENSSFIVSSAYPDKTLWGRGFVARLSGATAELLN
ncbi:MAG: hypothetical protein JW867_06655, partial [Candidatus Omnitrophica bacterium]|nr:hypothetical protein [Candidatus Omnitrophota bacterium]